MEKIIVTKHQAIELFLKEQEIVSGYTPVYKHISEEFAKGKHIYGIVPFNIAAAAELYTEVKLTMNPTDARVELTLEQLKAMPKTIRTYQVIYMGEEHH